MACIPLEVPTIPPLGFGLSIEPPALPPFSGDLKLCCKLLQFNIPPIPIPLPPLVFNAAVSTVLNTYLQVVQDWLDALPLDCPVE